MEEYVENPFIEEESEDVDLSEGKRTIRTNSSDPTIDGLLSKYQRGKLNIQPKSGLNEVSQDLFLHLSHELNLYLFCLL